MATLAEMTAAGLDIPVKLKDSEGKEYEKVYHMKPLTNEDFGELELWMQTRYVDQVKAMTKDLTDKEREQQLNFALARSVEITVTTDEGVRLMSTMEGMKRLIFISLRRQHPELTMEEVGKLMMNSDVSYQLLAKVDWLNQTKSPMQAPSIKLRRGKKEKRVKLT